MKTSIKQSLKSGAKGWLSALLVTAALMLSGAPSLRADNDHHDSDRHDSDDQTFGSKTLLSVFQDTYWRQFYAEFTLPADQKVNLPTDQNGHPVLRGIALMPLPDAGGDGTPASIDVTLKHGQRFFLPLWGFLGTSYTDGVTPPDPFNDERIFETLSIKVTVDGKTILDRRNAMDFYTKFSFDPPMTFNQFGIDSVIWLQHIGILHEALPPGKHVLKLDVKNTRPAPNLAPELHGIVEYHNTFNITVSPRVR